MSDIVSAVPATTATTVVEPRNRSAPGERWTIHLEQALDDLCAEGFAGDLWGLTELGDAPPEFAVPGVAELAGGRLRTVLADPVRHLLAGGGARLRPRLLLTVIDLLGGDAERYLPLAAAMELIHTGSLMVDDVQDEATLRRGRRPAHAVFGPAVAVNAGTAAYFTFDRALRTTVPDDTALRSAVSGTCLAVLRAGHAGQGLDLEGHRAEMDTAVAAGCGHQVRQLVRLTHRLKTGAPVRACMATGALLAGADRKVQEALGAFGEELGVSYQVVDDVLDLDGVVRKGSATKRAGEDLRNGKVTMPLTHAVDLLPPARMARLWKGMRSGRASERRVAAAAGTLRACGALEASRSEALSGLDRAWHRVEDMIGDTTAARELRTLAYGALDKSTGV